jgi:DNA modification methylase
MWVKPTGYIAISRRSGNLLKHPYPMYYYTDNLYETILIFQNGSFDYKKVSLAKKKASAIDVDTVQKEGWFRNVWNISNVMPNNYKSEKGIAKFPEEIPYRLIKLYSYEDDVVLDPFMGSGTTLKIAVELGRRCVGYEIDLELIEIVKKKLRISQTTLSEDSPSFDISLRGDAKHLRTKLAKKAPKARTR